MKSKHRVSLQRAEQFLKKCIRGGLAHSMVSSDPIRWVKPYPEVTGYLISYFCRYGLEGDKKIVDALDKLTKLQHSAGGYASFYNRNNLYSFDTGQIMHALLSAYGATKQEKYLVLANRAADFLISMQIASGLMFPIYDTKDKTRVVYKPSKDGSNWGSTFSYIQVKNAEGLLLLYSYTKRSQYLVSAQKLAKIGMSKMDYLYTHPLAYYMEGLLALGQIDRVKQILAREILPRIKPNGFVAYYPGAKFAYVSGSVQLGILLWKVGYKKQARSILDWAGLVQGNSESGGLYQYALASGRPDSSIHTEINSWGTKYYCELLRLVVN